MATTTLQDLLTLDLDTLTAIVDGTTDAKKLYVYEKLIAPIKLLAQAGLPDRYKYLGEDLSDPFYDNIQTLLDSTTSGSVVGTSADLIIKYYKQVSDGNSVISENRANTFIKSEGKDQFYIKVDIDPITDPLEDCIFENVTVIFANNSEINNCIFRNCIIKSISNGNISFSNSVIEYCKIQDTNEIYLSSNTEISSSKIKCNITFSDSTCKMYDCVYSTIPTNETNNLTMDGNIHLSNL